MTYRIQGLSPEPFAHLFALDDEELAARRARRVRAEGDGFPCRVSLEDAREGETVLLVSYVSHDVETPFRTRYAVYVRDGVEQAALRTGSLPPMLDRRHLSLRGFDGSGMLRAATIAEPGLGDAAVRTLLQDEGVSEVHAHNAAYGCFLARLERA
jgi:hypothetical protein